MLAPDTRAVVGGFFHAWKSASHRKQERLRATVPIAAMQQAANSHEDPWVRRRCLGFLEHYAADSSAAVFVGCSARRLGGPQCETSRCMVSRASGVGRRSCVSLT